MGSHSLIPSTKNSVLNEARFELDMFGLEAVYPLIDLSLPRPSRHRQIPNVSFDLRLEDLHARFLDVVVRGGDKKLPVRHLAPSLSRVLQPGGPYSPENLRTPAGLFSAFVFRGITHHTAFLHDHPTFFSTLDSFLSLHAKLTSQGSDERYFCFGGVQRLPAG